MKVLTLLLGSSTTLYYSPIIASTVNFVFLCDFLSIQATPGIVRSCDYAPSN